MITEGRMVYPLEAIRSFIAFDIENEMVVRNLNKIQQILSETGADLKLVEPENIHITVRFLGDIYPNMIEMIHGEMEKVKFTPFDAEVKGVGVFPNLGYIQVVWAGIQRGANELKDIFNQLEPNLRRLGFKPDTRGFSPHLTIARVRTSRNKAELARSVEELKDYEFGLVRAVCLRLKRSILTPKGPIYSVLKETCRQP